MEENKKLEDWIEKTKKEKELIKTLGIKDRLELVASITKLHGSILASLQGWTSWLKNPVVMNYLSEKELKETFEIFKRLALEFLDLDIKMSSSVLKKVGKVKRKKKKSTSKYIS
jgi:hypothetical protein